MTQNNISRDKAIGTAVAGGFVVAHLIDALIDKGILSTADASGLLQRAQNDLVPFMAKFPEDFGLSEAYRVISEIIANLPKDSF